jgi:flavin reductase (DIM6/NTAB) family NADH-FMN oxidoreductase RutF
MKTSLGPRTILYPAPVLIVGTYDSEGKPNAMTAAWGGICCSKPPCVTVSLRKATYTYGNIVGRKAYTISIPSEKHVKEADYFGIVSGRAVDKFSATGLTPVKSELVNAPYVKEFPIILECKLLHTFEIGLHTQFIGEILDVKVSEAVLGKDGLPDMGKVRPIVFAPGIHCYFGTGECLGVAFSIGEQIKP